MASTRNITKKIFADQLFERLNVEFPNQVQDSCTNLGIQLKNLSSPANASNNHRYTNQEPKNFNQILQIASDVSKSIPRIF